MNQDELEDNLIIALIRDVLKNKFYLFAILGIFILFKVYDDDNSGFKSEIKLSPLFIEELTTQIVELDELVQSDGNIELDELEDYSKNLTISAYVDRTSDDEEELIMYMEDFRKAAYAVQSSKGISRKVELSNYDNIKLVLMYELNNKRKSYNDLEILWDMRIFETDEPN